MHFKNSLKHIRRDWYETDLLTAPAHFHTPDWMESAALIRSLWKGMLNLDWFARCRVGRIISVSLFVQAGLFWISSRYDQFKIVVRCSSNSQNERFSAHDSARSFNREVQLVSFNTRQHRLHMINFPHERSEDMFWTELLNDSTWNRPSHVHDYVLAPFNS